MLELNTDYRHCLGKLQMKPFGGRSVSKMDKAAGGSPLVFLEMYCPGFLFNPLKSVLYIFLIPFQCNGSRNWALDSDIGPGSHKTNDSARIGQQLQSGFLHNMTVQSG